MKEGVSERKDDNNEETDEKKEVEFLDDTPHDKIEEVVSDKK